MSETKRYLAYGSNMNFEKMKGRCPDATVEKSLKLYGYKLVFRKRKRDGGVASIEKCDQDSFVPVTIWNITSECESVLDRVEGFPHLYRKETICVPEVGETMVYLINTEEYSAPLPEYFEEIATGYREAGFTKEIETVLKVAVKT